jgi:hypothetical protein
MTRYQVHAARDIHPDDQRTISALDLVGDVSECGTSDKSLSGPLCTRREVTPRIVRSSQTRILSR